MLHAHPSHTTSFLIQATRGERQALERADAIDEQRREAHNRAYEHETTVRELQVQGAALNEKVR